MIGGIEPHVARGRRRLDRFDHVILVGSDLMNHGQRAVRIRGKCVARGRIVPSAVVDQRRTTVAVLASISTTSFMSVRRRQLSHFPYVVARRAQ